MGVSFNLKLFGKWISWKLLVEKDALWYKELKAKYGEAVRFNPNLSVAGNFRNTSI